MLKPKYITDELMEACANRTFKIGGLIKNDTGVTASISRERLEDMKTLGFDYIITSYPNDTTIRNQRKNLNALLETLSNAEDVRMDVYAHYLVLIKNPNEEPVGPSHKDEYYNLAENISLNRLSAVTEFSSFKGVFHNHPTDLANDHNKIYDFYNTYKRFSDDLIVDVNLYPNYLSYFDDSSTSFNKNIWNTGNDYYLYATEFSHSSDIVGADFFPFYYNQSTNRFSVSTNKSVVWCPCLNTLLGVSRSARNRKFWMFIQTSRHSYYPTLTTEALSIQSYCALIGGAEGIRYYAATDDAEISGSSALTQSAYQSNTENFEDGETHDIVKYFNGGKFKFIKDFVLSKYIDGCSIYDRRHKPVDGDGLKILDEFVTDSYSYAYHMFSIAYDEEAAYCFAVNLSPESASTIVLSDDNVVFVVCDKDTGTFAEYLDTKDSQVNIKPGDICILKKYYSEN